MRLRVHSALRWLHIYISMASMIAVLFFAATGVTLNHPDWLAAESTHDFAGKLPVTWKSAQGVDWLVVAEYLRNAHGVRGAVADHSADDAQGSLTFKAPGYGADAFITMADGSYKLTVSYQGWIGVLNDFHRGRDAGRAWAWLIDVAGMVLVVLSATGLGLLWYLKRVRLSGLVTLAAGGVLLLILAKLVT
ncbi:MAG: PepSY-associated TM helix domain-containing protein [bacterium]